MKKGLLKSLLCFALAGTLLFGDAGLTLAAVSNDVQPAAQTQQVKSSTASVSSVNVYVYSDEIYYYFTGYGSKFEVYLNGKLWTTIDNYDEEYDYETGTWVPEEAPYRSYSDYINIIPQAGATYTIKVVPYAASSTTAGEAKEATSKREFPNVFTNNAVGEQTPVYDKDGLTTGYGKVYVRGYLYTSSSSTVNYEIYRADKKNGTYKLITTASGYNGDVYWSDNDVAMGKTYYYKMRPFTTVDAYVTTAEYGDYTAPIEVKLDKPTAECSANYDSLGVTVYAYDYNLATGFDVYRSTKESKGYKKIATTSDVAYIDTTAKSGKTYYYKLKPFFYNTETKKTVYGDYTEPVGVKLNLGDSFLEIKQTAKNKVKLEWLPVKGAVTYEIYKKSDLAGEGYKYVTSTKKTAYTAKVAADAYTSFRVRAVKKKNSIKSEYVVMSAGINTGFTSPRNLEISKKVTSIKNNTMTLKSTLKWDKVYGAKKYRVEVWDNEKGEYVSFTTKKTSYTVTNAKKLDGSWKYSSEVRVYAVDGDEEISNYVYGITGIANPTKVTVKKAGATSAKISWKVASGADTYRVYRRTPTGNAVLLGETTKTNFVDKKLTPGVNYYYTVESYNSKYYVSGYTTYTEDDVPTNQAIYNLKSAAPKISSVSKKAKVTWKKVDGATQYVVYRATSKKGKYEKVGTSKTTSFTDKKAKSGKTYYYKVVAVTKNDAGVNVESAMSAYKSAKIKK